MANSQKKILYFDTVTSTNDVLRDLAGQGAPEGTAVVAAQQTAGRGRLGRTFQSPAGLGLYLSVLYRPTASPEELPAMTALGAVAVCRALEQVTGQTVQIKWPNDLVMRGKKVGGILTESALNADGTVAHVIMGIGINVHHTADDFQGEVREMATSLAMQGCHIHQHDLAGLLLCKLIPLKNDQTALKYYRTHCLTVGQNIKVMSTKRVAVATDIDKDYGLAVRYEDGNSEVLRCGEVSVRGLYGYTR